MTAVLRLRPSIWGLLAGGLSGMAFNVVGSLKVTAALSAGTRWCLGGSAAAATAAAVVAGILSVSLETVRERYSGELLGAALAARGRRYHLLLVLFLGFMLLSLALLLLAPAPGA